MSRKEEKKWTVEYTQKVEKRHLPKLSKQVKAILGDARDDLEREGPFPYGWNVDVLEKGRNRMWLKRKWRIVYTIDKSENYIKIIYAGPREGVPY